MLMLFSQLCPVKFLDKKVRFRASSTGRGWPPSLGCEKREVRNAVSFSVGLIVIIQGEATAGEDTS